MRYSFSIPTICISALLAGCGTIGQEATRSNVDALGFTQSAQSSPVEDQARMLNQMAEQLVRRATVKGALTGAAIGCGLVVVSASNAKNCVAGAAAGGAVGALVGNARGQREVTNRVELLSANELVRSLRGMNNQVSVLQVSLPELLAEQDAELRDLRTRREIGAISAKEYDAGVERIRQSRARIAESLTLTSQQAKLAKANIEQASLQGQTGLDWHLVATAKLAREVHSARSSISLLDMPLASAPAPQPAVQPVQTTAEIVGAPWTALPVSAQPIGDPVVMASVQPMPAKRSTGKPIELTPGPGAMR